MSQNTSTLAVKNMPVRRLNTDERMKRTYLNLNLQAAQEDKQIARKHDIQRMRSIRHLKKHQPDSWLERETMYLDIWDNINQCDLAD